MKEYKLIENTSKIFYNGSKWKSNSCGMFIIIGKIDKDYSDKDNIKKYNYYLCKFEDGTITKANQSAINGGKVKNLNYPLVCGIGYVGQGKWLPKYNGKETKEYSIWKAMITRCYSKNFHIKNPAYIDVIVCDRWHCFQNFCEDIQLLDGYSKWINNIGYELDKDILCERLNVISKIYSPETCIFISKKDNVSYTVSKRNLTGLTYIGISPDNKEYEFTNQNDFALKHNLNRGTISACINKRRKQHKGWTFKIKE